MSLIVKRDETPEVTTESKSSVELITNSKGITTYKVKVYADDSAIAANEAVEIMDQLKKKYGVKVKLNFEG